MLKKLRRKFILLNMVMVSVVIVMVFSFICVISYQQSVNAVYAEMNESIETAIGQARFSGASDLFDARRQFDNLFSGTYPNNTENASSDDDSASSSDDSSNSSSVITPRDNNSSSDSSDSTSSQFTQPQIGSNSGNRIVPVAIYSMSSTTSIKLSTRASSAELSSESLQTAVDYLDSMNDGQGVIDSLGVFYEKRTQNGVTYLGFADEANANSWKSLALVLVLVGIGTLLVFFAISVFFSRWALRPVEEAWSKQHQFLADASHELKTPLTVIMANTDIMLKHPERTIASEGQWLESTQNEAKGMQELVTSMLDLARLEAEGNGTVGSAVTPHEPINFSDIAFGSTLQFESIAFEHGLNLADDIDDDITIKGDQSQIKRLVGTFLDNACKYAPADSTIVVSLKIKDTSTLRGKAHAVYQGTMPKGRAAVFSVSNEGDQIDPEDLAHLFDRFYRSDKARTHESSGNSYGLGLAIAAGTVEAHGGCIWAESPKGSNTVFAAALPLA